ncbi:MAG: hypothetical protein HXX12_16595 [Geothrix sp.]|uniref:hypothetical protein n=1 Tax=Geothrix sp. TaxID=1962974 RepID=UPI00184ACA6D|nr:hypothetical protein [Geothrix sp.]NWJ42583.1 hypothetical protein [Geothrix sp.]WIL19457.1 MAG: hypothetical protein QOZ81_001974 [Geothrix sp.]
MSTVNGCGTMFYGWRGRATPASTATKWITLFFLPIAPLGRYRLTPITDFDREMLTASAKEVAAALVGHGARTDISLISARLPIRFPEVLSTYFTAFVAVPFLMVWPWLLLYLGKRLFGIPPEWEERAWFMPAVVVYACVSLLNAVAVPAWAIQLARGIRPGLFRSRK